MLLPLVEGDLDGFVGEIILPALERPLLETVEKGGRVRTQIMIMVIVGSILLAAVAVGAPHPAREPCRRCVAQGLAGAFRLGDRVPLSR